MKIKFKFNIKPFFNYLSVILATAFGITMILIALPLTEQISEKTSFDLITKDSQYWSSEYILKLESTDKLQIESTRDILFNRLKKFNVERAKIYHSGEDEEGFTYLRVVITSTLPKDLVKELVSNRFDVQIMTRKEDVDFFDQEDQYAYLFADNYNPTDWDRSDFRNIYITNLKTSNNEYANFALFKLWPNKQGEFQRFLEEHKGEYLGVSIDGFVTPYLVPFDDFTTFAVPVSTEDEVQIEAIDILYNSGVIPVNYSIDSENDMEADIVRTDHIKISIGLAISLLLTYIYLFMLKQSDKNTLIKSFLATVLTISTYLAVLKIMQIPVDTFILPIVAILSFLLTKVLSENDDSVHYLEIGLILILLLVRFLGFGYMPIVATHLIALIILSKVYLIISDWYIYKVKSI